jgi:seven-transmembrane receptor
MFVEYMTLAQRDRDGGENGWSVAALVLGFVKGTFFFVLVALIGTGWSLVKPFLSRDDKKIIAVILPLQVCPIMLAIRCWIVLHFPLNELAESGSSCAACC